MINYIFPPENTVSMPIAGSDKRYPVSRIFCVGRNYEAHAAEMGFKSDKAHPFFFSKTPRHYIPSGASVAYPPGTSNYHFEMELVVAIGKPAFEVSQQEALDKVYGYCSGLDMTRRDLQDLAKEKRRPWDTSKDFEESCVMSELVPVETCGHIQKGTIALSVNGKTKQKADVADQINNVAEVIEHLSGLYHLEPGDIIMMGTPDGVGAVGSGDVIEGYVEGLNTVQLSIK